MTSTSSRVHSLEIELKAAQDVITFLQRQVEEMEEYDGIAKTLTEAPLTQTLALVGILVRRMVRGRLFAARTEGVIAHLSRLAHEEAIEIIREAEEEG